MRILASITAVLLFLFLLTSAPAFSQEGTDKPDHPQDEKAKDKDKDKDRAQPKQDDQSRRQDENRRDESRPEARPQEQTRPEERRDEHAGRPQEQNRTEGRSDRRTAQGQRGERIPEERFRSSFGREHHFHVERARIINQAQPEFVYSGYTFQLADPWPAEWSFDDDCYIDYVDDDYYLFDAYHPGFRILVFVIG